MKAGDPRGYTASEILDQVLVRMELLESVISKAAAKSADGGWVYQAMDIIEQIYDYLVMLKKRIDSCGGCSQGPS